MVRVRAEFLLFGLIFFCLWFFFLMIRRPPRSTLFTSTTLFRSVKIALDDFGTGYSSLQYINHLPFDYLKLDRAFVSQLFSSEKTEHMMRTIIGLAHNLRMDIVAEGVETTEQLSWLRAAGCLKAQGFYFSRPVAWAEAEAIDRKSVV